MRLVISSLGFLIPCFVAFRKRRMRHIVMSAALVCTSVVNHSVNSIVMQVIDVTYVHALFIYFTRNVRLNKLSGICLYLTPYVYYTQCKKNKKAALNYHVLLHLLGITGWTSFLSDSSPSIEKN